MFFILIFDQWKFAFDIPASAQNESLNLIRFIANTTIKLQREKRESMLS